MHHHDPDADTEIIKPNDPAVDDAGDKSAPAGDAPAGDDPAIRYLTINNPVGLRSGRARPLARLAACREPGDPGHPAIRYLTINDRDDLYRFCWIHHDLARHRGVPTEWEDLLEDERKDIIEKVDILALLGGDLPHGTHDYAALSAYDQDEQDRWRDLQHAVNLVIRARAEDPGARPNR